MKITKVRPLYKEETKRTNDQGGGKEEEKKGREERKRKNEEEKGETGDEKGKEAKVNWEKVK